tara:strand:- start:5225 stop:5764 length:540 start_codon:yes stop_codon:yes gene_type:complete
MNQTSDNIPVAIEQKPVNHVTLNVYPSQELLNRDNDIVIVNQELEIKSSIYNRSRVVYVLTIIDIVFLIINLIVSIVVKNLFWLFFILCPLCYLGNKGACEYKKDYVLGYSIYLFIMAIYYLFLSFYANSFLILIIFFIEIYFLIYTSRLYSYLKIANNEIIQSLRDGWTPDNVIVHYF